MTERRRTTLSRTGIVDSAIALADAEGLVTVTVRRLAREHGVSAMAFYAHFRDKDEILDAMAQRLLELVDLPDGAGPPSGGAAGGGGPRWDEQVEAILTAFVAGLRQHPAVAGLALRAMLECDAGLRISERLLGLLAVAGYPPDAAASVCRYLLSALIALVTSEPGRTHGTDDPAQARRSRLARLAALPPDRYGHVIAAADALSHCADVDTHYARGIRLMTCGLRAAAPA